MSLTRTWTVADLLGWTERYFRRLGLSSPRLDAELLLVAALGGSRMDLYTGYRKLVEPAERARFRALVERRARREPVAYLTGEREFFSLGFHVSPGVFIPRPESEHLVEVGLELIGGEAASVPARALDLGTGSGNLAVALAVKQPTVVVDAVDISKKSLEVARRNARRHGVDDRVRFLEGDLFEPLREDAGPYMMVLSNPPYVARHELAGIMEDVRLHEPLEALLDSRSPDGDGLGFYRAIAAGTADFLEPTGSLLLEVGDSRVEEVRRILDEAGFRSTRTIKDYAGIERVVVARPETR